MKTSKTIYKTDRVFFNVKARRIFGDMGYTFCESDETRTTDRTILEAGLQQQVASDINEDIAHIDDPEEIEIYLILQATATYDPEDYETEDAANLDIQMWDVESWIPVYSLIVCTTDYQQQIGLVMPETMETVNYTGK